ncbi:unnamed protein product [Agarophyton chilense]
MGGGNGAKSATKRDRNASKSKKGSKGSQMAANQSAMSIVCAVCRSTFMCTMKAASLRQHVESKHPKHQLTDCFPHLQSSDAK